MDLSGDPLQNILGLVGGISGLISLITVLYFMIAWKTGVDADRKAWRDSCTSYPPAELWTMCKTMWDVYVINVLQNRPDLVERHSEWNLKPEAKGLIPDKIREVVDRIPRDSVCRDDVANGWLVVKHIGLELISEMADDKGISVQEAIAVLSLYLQEERSH